MSNGLVLGWEEWVALPDLGLPALKAKVDTGAKSSALHAFAIEPFGRAERPRVRFGVHPIPERPDIEVTCSSDVLDRRQFTSSNGETESRFVIASKISIGGRANPVREWPIELSLTNREQMSYRMLLGRQGIGEDMIVQPSLSFQQPLLGYEVYDGFRAAPATRRPLRLLLLTREPNNYSNTRLKEAAEARGHELEMVDTSRLVMALDGHRPVITLEGRPLEHYDAVIPRIGASMTHYGLAVVRQFEMLGCFCLASAEAIGRSRDKLLAHQTLAREQIPMPRTAFAFSDKDTKDLIELIGGPPLILKLLASSQGKGVVLADSAKAAQSMIGALRGVDAHFLVQEFVAEANGADLRCFVVGGKVLAAMRRQAPADDFRANIHMGGTAEAVKLDKTERRMAVAAAKAIGLPVAGVDLLQTKDGPKVLEVNSSPGLEGIEQVSGKDLAGPIIDLVAANVKSFVHRPAAGAAAEDEEA